MFDEIRVEALSNISNEFDKDFKSYFNVSKAIKNLEKKIAPILSILINSSTKNGLEIINQRYNIETWAERNARISKRYSDRITDSINTLDSNLKDDVRRSLANNATLDPKDQLDKLLRDTESKFNDYYKKGRAETIARTNTTAVDNIVKRETWTEMGVRELEWVTEGDDRVRDSHEAMDGTRIEVQDVFQIEIYKDGQPTGEFVSSEAPATGGVASQDVNCRCTLLPIL